MNTKTTKFLAVLAVLAMAFAGVSVAVQQTDAANDHSPFNVATGQTITGLTTIAADENVGVMTPVKDGNTYTVKLVGVSPANATADGSDYKTTAGAANHALAGLSMDIAADAGTNAYLYVVESTANVAMKADPLIVVNKAGTSAIISYFKNTNASPSWPATDVEQVVLPVDGTDVTVKIYQISGTVDPRPAVDQRTYDGYADYVAGATLKATITLDCSDLFTEVDLSAATADVSLDGFDYATSNSGWKYFNSADAQKEIAAKTLFLRNYAGNQIFKLTDGANVYVEGNNTLSYVTKDGTKAAPYYKDVAAITGVGALSIKGSGNLTIEATIGDYNQVSKNEEYFAGIKATAGALSIDINGKLKIAMIGEPGFKTGYSGNKWISAYGIIGDLTKIATNVLTMGSETKSLDVEISVCETAGSSAIFANGGANLYINGTISAGNRALGMDNVTSTYSFINSDVAMYGHESAIKTRNGAPLKVTNSNLDLNIMDLGVYNSGDNITAALSLGGNLTVDSTSTISTDGLYIKNGNYTIANAGKVTISDDYEMNPMADTPAMFPGLINSSTASTAITAYSELPSSVTNGYILLDFEDITHVYGKVNVLDESGFNVIEMFDNTVKTADLEASFAKLLVIQTGTQLSESALTVPTGKTVKVIATALNGKATDGTTITAGKNVLTLGASAGATGTFSVSSEKIEIDGMSAGAVTVSGKATAVNVIKGTSTINLAANTALVLEDGLMVGSSSAASTVKIDGQKSASVTAKDLYLIGKNATNIASLSIGSTTDNGGIPVTITGDVYATYGQITTTGALVFDGGDLVNVVGYNMTSSSKASSMKDLNVSGMTDFAVPTIVLAAGTDSSKTTVKGSVEFKNGASMGACVMESALDWTNVVYVSTNTTPASGAYVSGSNITGFKAAYTDTTKIQVTGSVLKNGSDFARVSFGNGDTAKDVTIGAGVRAYAAGLTASGTLTILGDVTNAGSGKITLSNSAVIDVTKGKFFGKVGVANDYTYAFAGSDDKYDAMETYFTGFKLSREGSSTSYVDYIAGTLQPVGIDTTKTTAITDDDTLALTLGAGAVMNIKDTLTMTKGAQIVFENNAGVKGVIAGPDSNVIDVSVKGGNAGLSITAGSLKIAGQMSVNGSTGSVKVKSGEDVSISGTIDDKVAVALEQGTLTIDNALTVTGTLTTAAGTTLAKGSEATITTPANVTVAGVATFDASGCTIANGGSYTKNSVLYSKVKFSDDNYYTIGVKQIAFDGAAIAKSDIVLDYTGSGLVAKDETLASTPSAVGVYSTGLTVTAYVGSTAGAQVSATVPFEIVAATLTVTFNPNGGTLAATPASPIIYTYTTTDETFAQAMADYDYVFCSATKLNNKFTGWILGGSDPKVTVTESSSIFAVANGKTAVTLVATWQDLLTTKFTATFYDQDGKTILGTETDIEYYGKVTEPEIPEKEGYVFAGWYTSTDFTTKYNFKAVVTDDISLYALWTAAEPTATAVDIAVSKVVGGVKVTVAGADDLVVPSGTVTVTYYYWVTIAGQKAIDDKDATAAITMSGIVNSTTVSLDKTPVYVVVSYESADGKVTATTPIIMY